jgi:hypothetical protein
VNGLTNSVLIEGETRVSTGTDRRIDRLSRIDRLQNVS